MGSLMWLLIYYSSVVVGLQYADSTATFFGAVFGIENTSLQRIVSTLIIGFAFFLPAQFINRKLYPDSSESGCLTNLVTLLGISWITIYIASKFIVYIDPASAIELLNPFTNGDSYGPFINFFIKNEVFFDILIQAWFPPTEPYFLLNVITRVLGI